MGYCNDDKRITTSQAKELGYCTNCSGCNEETEDEEECKD